MWKYVFSYEDWGLPLNKALVAILFSVSISAILGSLQQGYGDVVVDDIIPFSPAVTLQLSGISPIGGEILTLDAKALLIAGIHTNLVWMVPVLSVVGIGVILAWKKF